MICSSLFVDMIHVSFDDDLGGVFLNDHLKQQRKNAIYVFLIVIKHIYLL